MMILSRFAGVSSCIRSGFVPTSCCMDAANSSDDRTVIIAMVGSNRVFSGRCLSRAWKDLKYGTMTFLKMIWSRLLHVVVQWSWYRLKRDYGTKTYAKCWPVMIMDCMVFRCLFCSVLWMHCWGKWCLEQRGLAMKCANKPEWWWVSIIPMRTSSSYIHADNVHNRLELNHFIWYLVINLKVYTWSFGNGWVTWLGERNKRSSDW